MKKIYCFKIPFIYFCFINGNCRYWAYCSFSSISFITAKRCPPWMIWNKGETSVKGGYLCSKCVLRKPWFWQVSLEISKNCNNDCYAHLLGRYQETMWFRALKLIFVNRLSQIFSLNYYIHFDFSDLPSRQLHVWT